MIAIRAETKATAISPSVKWAVWYRDRGECVLCGAVLPVACSNAHIVRRSQGGRGVEQNIVTLCPACHREMDEGRDAKALKAIVVNYIKDFYPNWTEASVTYHKGGTNA